MKLASPRYFERTGTDWPWTDSSNAGDGHMQQLYPDFRRRHRVNVLWTSVISVRTSCSIWRDTHT